MFIKLYWDVLVAFILERSHNTSYYLQYKKSYVKVQESGFLKVGM